MMTTPGQRLLATSHFLLTDAMLSERILMASAGIPLSVSVKFQIPFENVWNREDREHWVLRYPGSSGGREIR